MSAHVLVITDSLGENQALFEAVRARAALGPCTFRYVVTNPARAEFHVLHAERHDAVTRNKPLLDEIVEKLALHAASPVTGEISIRHDPFEAAEEEHLQRPADEVIVAVHDSPIAHRLHHDLPERLGHLGLAVTVSS